MLQSIVLGIVQGLTEFLPVSSSGHLVIVPALFNWEDPSLTFDLVLHLGTLVAVVWAFRHDLWALGRGTLGHGPDPDAARRMVLLLAIATIPAAALGFAFASFFEATFDNPIEACAELVVTGFILLGAEWLEQRAIDRGVLRPIDVPRATGIGFAQALAIFPGISRSGTTIAAALATGVPRTEAARFSFLLAIPAISGAVLSQVPDVVSGEFQITASVVAGFFAAMISGYFAIELFLNYVRTHSLKIFAYYLFVFAPIAAIIITLN